MIGQRRTVGFQSEAQIIRSYYRGEDPLKKKISSVMLESFIFYSGSYLPLHCSSRSILTNTADIIRLIIRDEAVHGYYVDYKFQQDMQSSATSRRAELREFAYSMLSELYDNEVEYARYLYDPLNMAEPVLPFMHFNGNRALANLGLEPLFQRAECEVPSHIMAALDPGAAENHDFFSGSGSSYVIGSQEPTADEDREF